MLTFNLRNLTLEGFKSFKSRVQIDFNDQKGINFLTGRNDAEPSLGANGAGKSSLWDGLFWCLYGTSINGDRASDLATWGVKRPHVRAVLSYGDDGDEVVVERWGSPDKLTVDGEAYAQADLNTLIRMSAAQCAQSIMFGQGARMFYDLTVPERGVLLNSIMDLSMWDRAVGEATKEVAAHQGTLRTLRNNESLHTGAIEALLAEIENNNASAAQWNASFDSAMDAQIASLDRLEQRHQDWKKEYLYLIENYKKPDRTELERLRVIAWELKEQGDHIACQCEDLQFKIKRFSNFDLSQPCPSCGQDMDAAHVNRETQEAIRLNTIAELELVEVNKKERKAKDAVSTAQTRYAQQEREAEQMVRSAEQAGAEMRNLAVRIEEKHEAIKRELDNKTNPHVLAIDRLQETLRDRRRQRNETVASIDRTSGEIVIAEYWQQAFKLIRLDIVKRILLHWQIDTDNAASSLGIRDWRIEYRTETETKTGSIRYGIQILVFAPGSDRNCALPSGGEGQRIRLAIEMGLASLIQRQLGVQFGFEVWDEPSNFLSEEGLEDMVQCLRNRAIELNKTVWLTDHRTYGFTFDDTVTVVKSAERGSYIERVNKGN